MLPTAIYKLESIIQAKLSKTNKRQPIPLNIIGQGRAFGTAKVSRIISHISIPSFDFSVHENCSAVGVNAGTQPAIGPLFNWYAQQQLEKKQKTKHKITN